MKKIGELGSNKKGLSDVITTVLIILLVLAAVIIIWVFVNPALKKAGGQITGDCVSLNLEPLSCDTNADNTTARVKRNSGEANVVGLVYVFEVNGEDKTRNVSIALQQLETNSQFYNNTVGANSLGGTPTRFTIAATIETDAGSLQYCPEVTPRINCE